MKQAKRPWVAFFSKLFHYIDFNAFCGEAPLAGGGARIMMATSSYSQDFGNSDAIDLP